MSGSIRDLSQEEFDAAIAESETPVVVDFWAEWCGPCKKMHPVLEELAEEFATVTFAKVNVEDAPEVGIRFDVSSIPTLIVFENGEPVQKIVGAKSKPALLDLLSPHL